MRICQSCGRENPPDQDFCQCGEYLRWDPTGVVQAVTPQGPEQASATIVLRLPEGDQAIEQTLSVSVEPGQRARALALVRNQSGIVDNYELKVEGMPDDWWSIFPDTVYLVPFGT